MIKKTGGPAFPTNPENDQRFTTLLDYFAAKAMQGLLSAATSDGVASGLLEASQEDGVPLPDYIARLSYQMADAMLRERDK